MCTCQAVVGPLKNSVIPIIALLSFVNSDKAINSEECRLKLQHGTKGNIGQNQLTFSLRWFTL